MKMLYKKECVDCRTQADVEVLDKILKQLRDIIRCPDGKDIVHYATKLMKEMGE